MGTASIHEGVRRMRFANLLDRQERGEITQDDAAEMLGISVRSFQRWTARFTSDGEAGLADGATAPHEREGEQHGEGCEGSNHVASAT